MFSAFSCCLKQKGKAVVGVSPSESQAVAVATKPKKGDPNYYEFLAPSVHHLSTQLMDDIGAAGLGRNSTIYDIENLQSAEFGVIRRKGADVICPIDQRKGAAYVHSINGDDNVGTATFMISYAWKYQIGDIIDSLKSYCAKRNLDPKKTYIWMCCLCVNQHRVTEGEHVSFDVFHETFRHRVRGIGHILALMAPWSLPEYLRRVWCIFEMYESYTSGCEVDIIMPPDEERQLLLALTRGNSADGKNGIDDLFQAFAGTNVENAEASQPQDKENILRLIREGPGYAELNKQINNYMREWVLNAVKEAVKKTQSDLKSDFTTPKKVIEAGTYISYIAAFFGTVGDKRGALDHYFIALELYESVDLEAPDYDGQDHDVQDYIARTYNNLGECLENMGDLDRALEYHNKCCKQFEEVYGTDHINTSASYFNIGAVKRKQEDYEGALEMFMKSLAIDERTNGTYHADTANTYDYIGRVKQQMGDLDGALEMFNKNMEISRKLFGDNHPNLAIAYGGLGLLHHTKEDYDSAIECHKKSIQISENILGTDHPDTASCYLNLGGAYYYKEKYDSALNYVTKAEDAYIATYGEGHSKCYSATTWKDMIIEAKNGAADE